ncbi:hypothetical protein LOTGIDRAFT_228946 [Lottia gigantea]|uniref:PLAT domain-containing protein n=1 Tax=Lottia gigantea TaxID=225164 RepID=V4BKA4_LOTGI|nr:hypothetical protein LOTGIDRAFT_228946 [Lottia gigantea]ESO89004.1 hypothetical protein LOTGIDRAFT_228946 [Lottia gigantea]
MSSNSIVKSVAKELKYYCDVKRLEDGFDLTGHQKNGRDIDGQIYKMKTLMLIQFPSLQYEDSEDDYLNYYYDCYETETPIVNMSGVTTYNTHGPREDKVKRKIKKHMTNYHFLGPKLPEYYYIYTAKPQLLPRASTSVGTRSAKTRSSKTRSLSRSTTKSDTNRLVNAAAKLLVATETVESLDSARSPRPQTAPRSFEDNQRPHTAKYSYDINGRKVFNTQLKYYDGNSSASDNNVRRTQSSRSPVQRPSSPTPSNTSDSTHSSSISIDDVKRLKTPAPPKSSQRIRNRTYINDGKKTDQEEVAVSVSMQTEFNDSVGIQTERRLLEKYDHTEDEVKEGPITDYEVIVITGTVNGASTKADVRITLYGEHGRTKEITLDESTTHKLKFQKGKEDRFNISAHHVGEIQKIKIGHDRPELSYAWYLECVTVSDFHAKKVYDFTCNRWLTGQNGDKNTYVYLSVERDRNLVENEPITPYESTVPRVKPDSVSKTPKIHDRPPSSQKQQQQKQRVKSDTSASSVEVVTPEKKPSKQVKQVQQKKKESSASESTYTSDSYTSTSRSDTESETEEEESREETIISLKGSPRHQSKANQRKISNDSSNKANGPTFTFLSKDSEKRGQTEKMKSETKRKEKERRDSEREEKREQKQTERSKSSKSRNNNEEDNDNKVDFLKGYKAGLEAAEKDSIRQREDRMEEDKRILTHGMTIHEAASNGHIERIKQLLDRFPELKESKDEKGLLPLHKSVIHGQTSVTKWLAALGVDLNQETPQSYTPMHLAALHGHVNIMMILAAMGAEVNCETIEKQTPLHLAARGGHLECVKWLVANRSVLTAEDTFGRKPVYLAEEFEKHSVADFLRACERELGNPDSGFAKMFNGSSSNMDPDKDSTSYKADVGSGDETSTVNGGESSTTTGSDIRKIQKIEERRKSYDAQHAKMEERGKSFLDSIRQDVEEDDE